MTKDQQEQKNRIKKGLCPFCGNPTWHIVTDEETSKRWIECWQGHIILDEGKKLLGYTFDKLIEQYEKSGNKIKYITKEKPQYIPPSPNFYLTCPECGANEWELSYEGDSKPGLCDSIDTMGSYIGMGGDIIVKCKKCGYITEIFIGSD